MRVCVAPRCKSTIIEADKLCRRHYDRMKYDPKKASEKRRRYTHKPNYRYAELRRSAKARDIRLSITFEEYVVLTAKPCFHCGYALPTSGGYGLDRIDSNKPYTLDNVVPCCKFCNGAKSYGAVEEFTKWLGHIKRNITT